MIDQGLNGMASPVAATTMENPLREPGETIRVVEGVIADADGAGRVRVAGQLDRLSRHAHADAHLRTEADASEQPFDGSSRPDVAVVVAVPAHGAAEQALAHRDGGELAVVGFSGHG